MRISFFRVIDIILNSSYRNSLLVGPRRYISMKLMVVVLVGPSKVRRNSLGGFVDTCYVFLQIKELERTLSMFMI